MQVRKRDKSKKVIVEEKKYDYVDNSSSSSSATPFDVEAESYDSFQPSTSDFSSSTNIDPNDEFSWVQRLQHIPDKVLSV